MSMNSFELFCNALNISVSSIIENYDNEIAPGNEVNEPVTSLKTPLALLKMENKHLKNEIETYRKIEIALNREIENLYKQVANLEFQIQQTNNK